MKMKVQLKTLFIILLSALAAVLVGIAVCLQTTHRHALITHAADTSPTPLVVGEMLMCDQCKAPDSGRTNSMTCYNNGFAVGFAEVTGTGTVAIGGCKICGYSYATAGSSFFPYYTEGYNAGKAAAAGFTAGETSDKLLYNLSNYYEDERAIITTGLYRIKLDADYASLPDTISSPISFSWLYFGVRYYGGVLFVTPNGIAIRYLMHTPQSHGHQYYGEGIFEFFTASDSNDTSYWEKDTARTLYVGTCTVNKSFYDWFIANTDYVSLTEAYAGSEEPTHNCFLCGQAYDPIEVFNNGYAAGYAVAAQLPAVEAGKCSLCSTPYSKYSSSAGKYLFPEYGDGYAAGQAAGEAGILSNVGYDLGYDAGYTAAEDEHADDFENGFEAGASSVDTDVFYQNGYDSGYEKGYTEGSAVNGEQTGGDGAKKNNSKSLKIVFGSIAGVFGMLAIAWIIYGIARKAARKRR